MTNLQESLKALFPGLVDLFMQNYYKRNFQTNLWLSVFPYNFKSLVLGRHSEGGIQIYINAEFDNSLKVGEYTAISDNFSLVMSENHTPSFVSNHMNVDIWFDAAKWYRKLHNEKVSVAIGNDVWIGKGVTIIGDVNVGDGAVIGANALVTKDIEPYEIVGGVPAAHLGYRFSKKIREELLSIRWWEWDEAKIRESAEDLFNIKSFIQKHAVE